jgi:polyhydroxybutyrate depolymerase
VAAGLLALAACSPPEEVGSADYAKLNLPARCAPGEKPGPPGATDRVLTSHAIPFAVRTPATYDATLAHPLVVLYAPGGRHRSTSEGFYELTREATSAGFVIAFPDHLKPALRAFDELGQIPGLVARQWCIDRERIYLGGHSDGGTTAAALSFLRKSSLAPAAIVVSAAGIRKQDLDAYACPPPVSVMVIHSRNDTLFPLPAYGKDAVQWWAACNRCEPRAQAQPGGRCVRFPGCAAGTITLYCETSEKPPPLAGAGCGAARVPARAAAVKLGNI